VFDGEAVPRECLPVGSLPRRRPVVSIFGWGLVGLVASLVGWSERGRDEPPPLAVPTAQEIAATAFYRNASVERHELARFARTVICADRSGDQIAAFPAFDEAQRLYWELRSREPDRAKLDADLRARILDPMTPNVPTEAETDRLLAQLANPALRSR
jgi:hypothetical protein